MAVATAAPPAALRPLVPEDELRRWKDHKGPMRVWCAGRSEEVVFTGWTGKVVLHVHGLSGDTQVLATATGKPIWPTMPRVHLCRTWPCGVRFDNRRSQYAMHGRVLELRDAPFAFDQAASPS